jgi:hypothetical protein
MEAGTLDEIHVLCAPALQPKQVVRNIESALCAGLGMRIDRRIVSVAQLRAEIEDAQPKPVQQPYAEAQTEAAARQQPDARTETTADTDPPQQGAEPRAERGTTVNSAERDVPSATPPQRADSGSAASAEPMDAEGSGRFLFVGYDASIDGGRTTCRVSIRRARRQFTGTGSGSNTAQGRVTAAAEALLNAVADASAEGSMGLDGATITELGGRPFVLVSALGLAGRENTRLTGIAALVRSPEEAAILAGLQAANRWSETR